GRERARAEPRPRPPESSLTMSTPAPTVPEPGPVAAPRERRAVSLFQRDIVVPALLESVKKLDPRVQIRNPVMFVVEIGAVITTFTWVKQVFGGRPLGSGSEPAWYTFLIALWLWLTVIF